jgi:hypothetical protein
MLLVGCGPTGGLQKVVVEGSVSYDGTPVENGEIRFHPAAGTAGPVSGAPIVAGRFRIEAKGGVPVGSHLVQIEAYDNTGVGGEMIGGGPTAARTNYLPSKYNRDSELSVDIAGDRRVVTRDFDLLK